MKTRVLGLLAVGLLAGPANGQEIVGAMSLADGYDLIPDPVTDLCIVNCTPFGFPLLYNINNIANVLAVGTSPTSDLAGTASVVGPNDLTPALATANGIIWQTDTGFVFRVDSFALLSAALLNCDGGLCSDTIAFEYFGFVENPSLGTGPTRYRGTWTAQGECNEGAVSDTCDVATISSSWSSSLASPFTTAPEPGSLALLGVGLAGLGLSRRRKAH